MKRSSTPIARVPLSTAERAEYKRLRRAGKTADYIRGWIYAGRILERQASAPK